MARLIDRLTRRDQTRSTLLDPSWFTYNGIGYPAFGQAPVHMTDKGEKVAEPLRNLIGYAHGVYEQNGPVAALVFVRQLGFSTVEFKFQNLESRRLFGSPELRLLEEPWQGGTTQNLLSKVSVDGDLAGNSYWRRHGNELVRMRPDWVDVVLGDRGDGTLRKVGYIYYEGGKHSPSVTIHLPADEVAHFMPLQDPTAEWRGMSWLTPVIREVMVDQAAQTHQRRFFENAATPNLAVTFDREVTEEQLSEFKQAMDSAHRGAVNAYKTLYLGGGADVTVVGTDLSKLDLKSVQGGLETRLAAAAGVPAVVVGFREGMQGSSLNAGNFGQARRRFADLTLDPMWREVAGTFSKMVRSPQGSRLWFDTRHVPFLREDAKDEAEIFSAQAGAVRQLLDAGFKPDAAVDAAETFDLRKLAGQHSGKLSVQLQPMDAPPDDGDDDTDPAAAGSSDGAEA